MFNRYLKAEVAGLRADYERLNDKFHSLLREAADKREGRARTQSTADAIAAKQESADLISLASMLRIPIAMHNVPEEKLFRPSAWSLFGMDVEGADYRACAAYGPLYA